MAGEKTISPEEMEQAVASLSSAVSNSGGRFYWVTGVSVLNTLLTLLNTGIFFPSGLMVTLLSDFAIRGSTIPGLRVFCIIFNLFSYGLYLLLGYFAVRRQQWALITGFVLYTLDTLLMLPMYFVARNAAFYLLINGAFHIWILYIVFQGIRANSVLKKIEYAAAQAYYQNQMAAQPGYLPPFPQSAPNEQPPAADEQPALAAGQPVPAAEQPPAPDEQPQDADTPPPPPPGV